MYKVTIIGLDEAIKRIQGIDQKMPKFQIDTMLRTVLWTLGQIPPYPPPPPGSKYRRTMRLGQSITSLASTNPDSLSKVEPMFGGVRGIIGTNVSYAHFVIKEGEQAAVHQGRWWTLERVIEGLRDKIIEFWSKEMDNFIRGL